MKRALKIKTVFDKTKALSLRRWVALKRAFGVVEVGHASL